jgi:hypothetical protein
MTTATAGSDGQRRPIEGLERHRRERSGGREVVLVVVATLILLLVAL